MLLDMWEYLQSGNYAMMFVRIASMLFVVFCTAPVHECAHAWMAVKLGDDTPRLAGRLTLRPMAHIDPIGAIMIFLFGFGYAKPVQVNMHNLKNGRKSFALVALAGPVSNLIMALIFFLCKAIVDVIMVNVVLPENVYIVLAYFFYFAASVNISLAVFNLLPIPPLDGSRILTLLLPSKYYFKLMQYERYIRLAVFALIFLNILTIPLGIISSLVTTGFTYLAELPFRLMGLL